MENDLFSIYVTEGASSRAHDFRMHGAIWSGPGDLLGLLFGIYTKKNWASVDFDNVECLSFVILHPERNVTV